MTDQIETPVPETLTGEDRYTFEIAKARHQLVLKDLETALAKKETADAEFRYTLLQLHMKYGLKPGQDNIDTNGNITRKETK